MGNERRLSGTDLPEGYPELLENLKYISSFAGEYPEKEFVQEVLAQLGIVQQKSKNE